MTTKQLQSELAELTADVDAALDKPPPLPPCAVLADEGERDDALASLLWQILSPVNRLLGIFVQRW